MKPETIKIDEVLYVRADLPASPPAKNQFIVRTQSAGVFAGEITARTGKDVQMKNARRLWYWAGAATLSQLAESGTSKPKECKFPEPVQQLIVTEAIEILAMTEAAVKSIASVPVWKA